MNKNPKELDAMARRYLDLWQEQWSSFATNPETAAQFGRMMEMMAPASGMLSRLFDPEASPYAPSSSPPHPHGKNAPRHHSKETATHGSRRRFDDELDEAGDDETEDEYEYEEENEDEDGGYDREDEGKNNASSARHQAKIRSQANEARAEATAAALQSVLGSVVDLARRIDAIGQRLESLEQRLPPDEPLMAQKEGRTRAVRRVAKRDSGTKTPSGKPKTPRSGSGAGNKRKAQ